MKYTLEMFGYYDDPASAQPAYDPGLTVPCLLCNKPWKLDNCRTISLMANDPILRDKSYFYRVHTDCHELWMKSMPDHIEPPSQWLMTYTTAN